MSVPASALTLAYWLHMLATVLWIGGISTLAILVLPTASKTLDAEAYAALLESIQKRLDPLGWVCLAVLAATGLVQMSANPNYQGFIAIHNRCAAAILVKHLLFLVMTGLSVYLSWGLLLKLRRLAVKRQWLPAEALSDQSASLGRQEVFLLRLNLILGVLILALTAIARSA